MTRAALILCAALLATPAAATQDAFPALYDVTGVAANDVLNLRAAPNAGAPVVGTLAPDATGVEVVELAPGVDWGRVNIGETSGWVSLAYMARRPGQFAGAPPDIARCFGTEPFWGLTAANAGYIFSGVDIPPRTLTPTWQGAAAGRADRHGMTFDAGTAVITTAACSDGMSDRRFGLAIDLLLTAGDTPLLYSGCCTLQR
ncbi:SH3 domain-containing protein [Pseudooceanicola sp. LIPI14-2-Ac024]|uniref:SH3 domain-containing protein n=1 Tax=Pseudooceanicola sp. LIPI14-2-Ac024 TaxID=3344875 RepID=UPI0035CED025